MKIYRALAFAPLIIFQPAAFAGEKVDPLTLLQQSATRAPSRISSVIESDKQAQTDFEQGKISEKQLQTHYEASRLRTEKIVARHPNDPFALIGAANSALQRAHGLSNPSPQDERQWLDYANRAATMARRQNNPEALELALRTSAIGKYYAGDYPGATADAKAALGIDRRDPVAATVIAAIG